MSHDGAGRKLDIPRGQVAAPPRPRRGYSVETRRGRGRELDIPWGRVGAVKFDAFRVAATRPRNIHAAPTASPRPVRNETTTRLDSDPSPKAIALWHTPT